MIKWIGERVQYIERGTSENPLAANCCCFVQGHWPMSEAGDVQIRCTIRSFVIFSDTCGMKFEVFGKVQRVSFREYSRREAVRLG